MVSWSRFSLPFLVLAPPIILQQRLVGVPCSEDNWGEAIIINNMPCSEDNWGEAIMINNMPCSEDNWGEARTHVSEHTCLNTGTHLTACLHTCLNIDTHLTLHV